MIFFEFRLRENHVLKSEQIAVECDAAKITARGSHGCQGVWREEQHVARVQVVLFIVSKDGGFAIGDECQAIEVKAH